ncbi:MAG TPA: NAD-binding protein [Planctomycetota bacterium]|nr:NAD-binding protein [Planctomycetota bacterium]
MKMVGKAPANIDYNSPDMSVRALRKLLGRMRYIVREFRWPLVVFGFLVIFGGALFSRTMALPYGKACFGVFMLIFVQPSLDFPDTWYNQALFFLIPIVGLGAVADSVVRLGYLIFSSKRKLQEWWIMEASTYRNHIVLCGLGRVGYRIVEELLAAKEAVVAIEKDGDSMFVEEMQDRGVPVLIGEARLKKNLLLANIQEARAIILATNDDLANLDAALTARDLRPDIKVVLRLFDDTLATKVAAQFQMPVISTSQVSAPAFVAAVTGRSVHQYFQMDGQTIHLADLRIHRLPVRTVSSLQKEFGVSVVLHKRNGAATGMADPDSTIQSGDILVVAASADRMRTLEEANRG